MEAEKESESTGEEPEQLGPYLIHEQVPQSEHASRAEGTMPGGPLRVPGQVLRARLQRQAAAPGARAVSDAEPSAMGSERPVI